MRKPGNSRVSRGENYSSLFVKNRTENSIYFFFFFLFPTRVLAIKYRIGGSKLNKGNAGGGARGDVMFVDYGDNPLSYNTSNIDNVNRALWNVIALQPLTAPSPSPANG